MIVLIISPLFMATAFSSLQLTTTSEYTTMYIHTLIHLKETTLTLKNQCFPVQINNSQIPIGRKLDNYCPLQARP